MKVVHLSTCDIVGGAARASYRLHQGLQRIGCDSSLLVAEKCSSDPTVIVRRSAETVGARLNRRLRREGINRDLAAYRRSRPLGYEPFRTDRTEFTKTIWEEIPSADIVNLHWVANFVDYTELVAEEAKTVSFVWTLHDMNAFTGGCHYDHDCGRFVAECGNCPQLGSRVQNDLSRRVWRRKRAVLERLGAKRLHLVAPSRWLAAETRRSSLLNRFAVSVIPYGLDLDDFAPRDKEAARDVLGIPRDAGVILFAAFDVECRRKGFALVARALEILDQTVNPFLVSIGSGRPQVKGNIPLLHLGVVNSDRLLSLIYSAADVFVIPSLQDNLPNTAIEAMACGTPVVGFDVGGIPDLVRTGITGEVVPLGDVNALRDALVRLLSDPAARAEMSSHCRRVALAEYPLETQARRYMELYQSILAESEEGPPATPHGGDPREQTAEMKHVRLTCNP